MKRVIFTVYDDIDVETDLDKAAIESVSEYFDRLVQNKKDYAELIGSDFKFFHNTLKQDNFYSEDNSFTNSNLYKHKLFADLAHEYDQVMYVDMDVIFNTNKNVFEEIDLSNGIAIKDQDHDILNRSIEKNIRKDFGKRNPTLKYHITKDLLDGGENHVINTGIMIGNSDHIQQLKYFDRLPEITKRIYELKEKTIEDNNIIHIRNFYYSNNESIFSYILEKYNIPYQILDDTWHDIRDHNIKEEALGNIVHFINKRFNHYFNDKSKAIFSMYIDIHDSKLDNPGNYVGDTMNKSKRTQLQLRKYYDQLIHTKQKYADSIGAKFIMFENDNQYKEFAKQYSYMSEYNIVNLYKIYLTDQLSKEYDYVLYLDFDVHCRRNVDIFNILNCDYFMQCQHNYPEELGIENDLNYFNAYNHDFRSPHSKYWNAHALLTECGLDPENVVFNTGIIAASNKVMNKLKYFEDIHDVLNTMSELKNESMYPEKIQAQFGYDNETIFAFKIFQNEVPYKHMSKVWHFKHFATKSLTIKTPIEIKKLSYNANMKEHNPVFVHFISKQFELEYEN